LISIYIVLNIWQGYFWPLTNKYKAVCNVSKKRWALEIFERLGSFFVGKCPLSVRSAVVIES